MIGFIGYRVLVNEEEKANSATIAVPSGTGPSPNTLGNSLAEIRFLYVVPEYRRRAVGSLLLATAYEHASQVHTNPPVNVNCFGMPFTMSFHAI